MYLGLLLSIWVIAATHGIGELFGDVKRYIIMYNIKVAVCLGRSLIFIMVIDIFGGGCFILLL